MLSIQRRPLTPACRRPLGMIVRLAIALLSVTVCAGIAIAHPGRGIVSTRDGTIYFADAGRSVVWKCTPDGRVTAAAPGVHAHWLALDPTGTAIYADHLRYDTAEKRFTHGLVRIMPSAGGDRVEDVIPPDEAPRGLATGTFLIEADGTILRVSDRAPARLLREALASLARTPTAEPVAPTVSERDRVVGIIEGESSVGGIAATADGEYILTVGREVRAVDARGTVRVKASAEAIAKAAPTDASPASRQREALYGDALWGLCVLKDGAVLVCDASNRRVLRIAADGEISIWHTTPAPWSPVGVTTSGDDIAILEAGFEPPSRNLGPRVVLRKADGSSRVLGEVAEQEPSRPYR